MLFNKIVRKLPVDMLTQHLHTNHLRISLKSYFKSYGGEGHSYLHTSKYLVKRMQNCTLKLLINTRISPIIMKLDKIRVE